MTLKDLLQDSPTFDRHMRQDWYKTASKSTALLGYAYGECITLDLADAPHVLIAGETGSGKSVMLHNIVLSLALRNTAETMGLVMIDPKQVELSMYKNLGLLELPIAKGSEEAIKTLDTLCTFMDNRYKMMESMGARRWNGKRIYVVIDELADLMFTSGKQVEKYIVRLAQLGRACGIHLIIATQRPEAKVITGLIKANIPTRICLPVVSWRDSMIILDEKGGEQLENPGDAILKKGLKKIRFKGVLSTDQTIDKVVDYLPKRVWTIRKEEKKEKNNNGLAIGLGIYAAYKAIDKVLDWL